MALSIESVSSDEHLEECWVNVSDILNKLGFFLAISEFDVDEGLSGISIIAEVDSEPVFQFLFINSDIGGEVHFWNGVKSVGREGQLIFLDEASQSAITVVVFIIVELLFVGGKSEEEVGSLSGLWWCPLEFTDDGIFFDVVKIIVPDL